MSKTMPSFPKFNALEYLNGKPQGLDTLGGLGARTLFFKKTKIRLDDTAHERFEERAAILEYDGGLQRDRAEHLALCEIIELKDWIIQKQLTSQKR